MWPFGFWDKYPNTNFHELNADWILAKIRGLEGAVSSFIKNWSSPKAVSSYMDFTDTKVIYLYTGDEIGYNKNHWYYYEDGEWKDGGLYGSAEIDDQLSDTSTKAVQNKVITNALDLVSVKSRFVAHRGYPRGSTWARDNSAMSIVEAFVNGFAAVELDARKDALGNIVMLHNPTVDSVSTTTGNISELDYTTVNYASEIGVNTGTNLTSMKEAIGIAKAYNGLIIFDLSSGAVTCEEIAEACAEQDFKKYGVINASPESSLADLPEYAFKVWGNDVFTHTDAELDGYLSYNTENNYVRLLAGTINTTQVNLIKSKGFGIMLNYSETSLNNNVINQELLAQCDLIIGDYLPTSAPNDKYKMSGTISDSVSMETWIESLSANSMRVFQMLSTHPENTTGHNLICTAVKISENYATVTGITTEIPFYEFKKVLFTGSWSAWGSLGNPRIVYNETEETYGITIKLCSCGNISTIDFYTENTLTSSSGWTTIYTLPAGYRPLTPQRASFDDSSGDPIRMYIGTDGTVQLYDIPAGRQISGQMTIIH